MFLRFLCCLLLIGFAARAQVPVIPIQIAATISPASPTVNDPVQIHVQVLSPSEPIPARAVILLSIRGVGTWFRYEVPVVNQSAVVRSPPLPFYDFDVTVVVGGTTVSAASDVLTLPLRVRRGTITLGVPTTPRTTVSAGQTIPISSLVAPRFVPSITFDDGKRILGSTFVDPSSPDFYETSSGLATIQATFPEAGLFQVRARFAGNAGYAVAESEPLQIEVRGAATLQLTSLTPAATTSTALRLDARATGQGATPSGQVKLLEGAAVLSEAALNSNGIAQFTLPAGRLAPGRHLLHAIYAGDRFYDAVSSPAVSQEISQTLAPTQTKLSLDLADAVRVRATVQGGATPASGTVTFRDAKTGTSYAVALSNGSASLQRQELLGHWVEASYEGDPTHAASNASRLMVMAPLNGFSYRLGNFAPEEVVTIFGESLGTAIEAAGASLPETLAGAQVTIVDSKGAEKQGAFYFASPTQATFVVPSGLAQGLGELRYRSSTGDIYAAAIRIAGVAPGLATANADGQGAPAAQLLRVLPDGNSAAESPLLFDVQTAKWVAAPIWFLGHELYLILYGTGFRGGAPVTCSAGDVALPVLYGGAQGTYAGLDQINLRLPSEMQGRGTVAVKCSAGGVEANPVDLLFP